MVKPLSILYYSYAFLASHGGRLHSEAFVKEAKKSARVKTIDIHPNPASKNSAEVRVKKNLRRTIKKSSFFQILSFYRRNYHSYRSIVPVLKQKEEVNSLHIRVDSNFLIIPRLRTLFPHIVISTEVNASPFDENIKNIAFRKYFRKLERKALAASDANFFVSDFLRKRIMKSVDASRDFVVHNGVNLEIFKPFSDKKEKDVFTFGYIGTIDYHKELKVLIEAFHRVYDAAKGRVELLIIGDGPNFKELQTFVRKKELAHAVEFKGRIPHEEILENLKRMDVAIHHFAKPYMSPLKIFEYLAVGLPVIAPDTPAVREIFTDGEDLVLVNGEIDDIVAKMLDLMRNRKKAMAIANKGCEKVHAQFGWKQNAESVLSRIELKFEEKHLKN